MQRKKKSFRRNSYINFKNKSRNVIKHKSLLLYFVLVRQDRYTEDPDGDLCLSSRGWGGPTLMDILLRGSIGKYWAVYVLSASFERTKFLKVGFHRVTVNQQLWSQLWFQYALTDNFKLNIYIFHCGVGFVCLEIRRNFLHPILIT